MVIDYINIILPPPLLLLAVHGGGDDGELRLLARVERGAGEALWVDPIFHRSNHSPIE